MDEKRPVSPARPLRPLRAVLPVVLYLGGFGALLVTVCWIYLFPALRAAAAADSQQKRELGATAWLILAVVLFVLFAGLLLAFRVGRFFFPRPLSPRKATEYVDAWAESGRRMKSDDGPAGDAEEQGPPSVER